MTSRSPVAAVILAAGLGRRFGSPKVVAQLGGQTLLLRVSRLAREAGLNPIIAVVPRGAETPSRVDAVVNTDPARGLSSSLRLGIAAVPANRAALVLLVDQPTMPRETISAVLAARGRRPLVVATADDRYGPPVLIEPEAFDLVSDLSGDVGLRDLLVSRPDLVESVEVPAHAPDVDTAADLERLEDRLGP
ncbi:MAG TPA: nucleotidyltransferase family protein [Candidatus Limnocylindria bacterium]|jgi:CTP:molybdopterin cytidylyltransferase MocA|nr:nucleotidyltransferase family protein [Candidatus Limnocylindria bacterium]